MATLKDVYEAVYDLAIKANLPTEVAKLRGKLKQLEEDIRGGGGQLNWGSMETKAKTCLKIFSCLRVGGHRLQGRRLNLMKIAREIMRLQAFFGGILY
jgi:hypothetical protein